MGIWIILLFFVVSDSVFKKRSVDYSSYLLAHAWRERDGVELSCSHRHPGGELWRHKEGREAEDRRAAYFREA